MRMIIYVWVSVYHGDIAVSRWARQWRSSRRVWRPVASSTKEVNWRIAKRPLKTNGRLANRQLTNSKRGHCRPLLCRVGLSTVMLCVFWVAQYCIIYYRAVMARSISPKSSQKIHHNYLAPGYRQPSWWHTLLILIHCSVPCIHIIRRHFQIHFLETKCWIMI